MAKGLRCRLLLAAALVSSACTVSKSEAPPLTGPSELALSVRVTATPDSVSLDGGSQSAVVVEARDVNGAPRPGLPVRLDIFVGQTAQDCGQLSARNVVTGSDGRAFSVFTAPAMPLPLPQCQGFSGVVTIAAIPSGNNFDTSQRQSATIRMVPPGVILPPASTPTPCFTVSPTNPTANTQVRFTGGTLISGVCESATSDIISFAWNFGDGGTGSGQTVTHSFAVANTYNVTLTETNDRGLSASRTQTVAVGAGAVPTATFVVSPTSAVVGAQLFFDASGSRAGAGHTIVQYRWNWGDGDPQSVRTGPTEDHDFTAAGTYTVVLTVIDESGQQANFSKEITVGTGNPVAVFTFSPTSPTVGTSVNFDANSSTTSGGATILQYTWSFGDGSASQTLTTPNVAHTFAAAASYIVTLTIKDSQARAGTSTQTVTVK